MLLVLALATLGIGYGMWDKILYIDGTVNTGEVDADFDAAFTDDSGTNIDPGYDKHVASCEVSGVGTQTLYITIENAYPSYRCRVDFQVTNTGTIPVIVNAFNTTGVPAELDVTLTDLPIGTQIDPPMGEAHGDVEIHVLQTAAELANYGFSAEIQLIQWNEF